MKAKYLTILTLALSAMFSSCDMDLEPQGQLDDTTALETVSDAERFRNIFYVAVRGFSSGGFFTYPEIQADNFNGLTINGNRLGEIANGVILSSNSDMEAYWATLYFYIANTNYFLQYAEPIYKKAIEENNTAGVQQMERYIGEAHFFRGYFYAHMMDRYCQKPTAELMDKEGTGLPIVTVYNPTSDRGSYPGRSTLRQTIDFISNEIELGRRAMLDWEELNDSALRPMANYLSSYAIDAMQARMALWIGDYDTAIAKSKAVIDSEIYTLSNIENYADMWTVDTNNEIIFMPYEDNTELGSATGATWISSLETQADYIPGTNLIANLQQNYNKIRNTYDVRFQTFIGVRSLATSYGNIGTPCFNKFPGNPALMVTNTPNLVNAPKTFRLSEQYLILAEASYQKGDQATANKMIKTLKTNRYKMPANFEGYPDLSGDELWAEIIQQRTLELVGEGFRLSDLRRWGLGFTRSSNYGGMSTSGLGGVNKNDIASILTPAGLTVRYEKDDHRYTWPIPSTELQVNPQMKGQQNPGY